MNYSKALIEHSSSMGSFSKNVEECDPSKKKIIIVFYVFLDIFSNKKLSPIVNELFIRGRKPNISLPFISQSYFAVPKKVD